MHKDVCKIMDGTVLEKEYGIGFSS
jgi:hypothetical protein